MTRKTNKTKIQGNEVQEQEREIYGYLVVKLEDRLRVAYMLVDHDDGIYLDATDQDISQHGGLAIVAPAGYEVFGTREEAQEYIDEYEAL